MEQRGQDQVAAAAENMNYSRRLEYQSLKGANMNRVQISAILAFVLAFNLVMATSGQDKPQKTFLSTLKIGQTAVVKEIAGRYEIMLIRDVRHGHTVKDVGTDYVVFEDALGTTETRVPIYSIKAIIKVKVP